MPRCHIGPAAFYPPSPFNLPRKRRVVVAQDLHDQPGPSVLARRDIGQRGSTPRAPSSAAVERGERLAFADDDDVQMTPPDIEESDSGSSEPTDQAPDDEGTHYPLLICWFHTSNAHVALIDLQNVGNDNHLLDEMDLSALPAGFNEQEPRDAAEYDERR